MPNFLIRTSPVAPVEPANNLPICHTTTRRNEPVQGRENTDYYLDNEAVYSY